MEDAEAALRQEIQLVAEDGINDEELRRVKAQVMAAEVYKLDSVFYQAMKIGQMEGVGLGHQALELMLEKIKQVTAEQVQQVAKEFFKEDQLTVAVLDPQPLPEEAKRQSTGGSHAH